MAASSIKLYSVQKWCFTLSCWVFDQQDALGRHRLGAPIKSTCLIELGEIGDIAELLALGSGRRVTLSMSPKRQRSIGGGGPCGAWSGGGTNLYRARGNRIDVSPL